MYRRTSQFVPGLLTGVLITLIALATTGGADAIVGNVASLFDRQHAAIALAEQGPRCDAACCLADAGHASTTTRAPRSRHQP